MTSQSVAEPSTNFLHSKRYVAFLFSSLLSNIGTWMQQIAQPWIILSISHSSFLIGLDSFAMNAPGFIFTLWGGVLSDRFNRMKVVFFSAHSVYLRYDAVRFTHGWYYSSLDDHLDFGFDWYD